MIASCGFLVEELRQCSKEEGVTMADSVKTLRVDLRTRVKSLGVKEKARRQKCKVRFSLISKNESFQKHYMKVGVKKLFRAWMVPAKTWREHAVEMAPAERLVETLVIGVEEELTQAWAEGTWIGKWYTEQEEAWLNPGSESPNVEASERSARSSDVRDTWSGHNVAEMVRF